MRRGTRLFKLCLLFEHCCCAQDVLSVLHRHACVVAYFAGHEVWGALRGVPGDCVTCVGHQHEGGYARDHFGIHHVTVEAIIECPPESNACVCSWPCVRARGTPVVGTASWNFSTVAALRCGGQGSCRRGRWSGLVSHAAVLCHQTRHLHLRLCAWTSTVVLPRTRGHKHALEQLRGYRLHSSG